MPSPFDQSTYQVRLDWGTAGLARLAASDVVIVVDVLRFSSTVIDAVASGAEVALAEAEEWSRNGAAVASAVSADATVLVGGIRNASAVARAVQTIQERRQARTSVAVIAAGEADAAGALRFAVEDQLGAGAIILALSDRGIDHTAPDAAVAAEGFRALRGAVRHMVGASGSGRELAVGVEATARIEASGLVPTSTTDAAVLDAVDVVPVLRQGSFIRLE
ncbi:2-phosphosulfolactate phosphatase [Microbacterium sp. Se5.02b]|uniref:2-phosphosulfolactate phosphatase n=1 Tax=Microbacterium sp. Se5.02b TaxID=2864103 RepID=UPI001C68D0C1|nr:2-phosphosulfolactate phosphatase [Microbacterium sp. Se5.02b]QYM65166.1 2-phosphosulfolactate phosphatase [Microbacterium sp. Se5.02b]